MKNLVCGIAFAALAMCVLFAYYVITKDAANAQFCKDFSILLAGSSIAISLSNK